METKFKIGDRVKNTKGFWSSALTNRNDNYQDIGIEGKIVTLGVSTNTGNKVAVVIWDNGGECGKPLYCLELITQNKSTTNNIQMKYFKTKEILSRSITVCVTVYGSNVNTGYAVRRMDDEPNVELAKRISLGRANNTKTNLTKGMLITPQLTEKYILAAIANKVLADIENGTIVIKGIR